MPTMLPLPSIPLISRENYFLPGGYHIGTKGTRPWCHTLSNPVFGTLLSDMSLGYTWALNSRQNKLTPWSNDVCSDFSGERLYIKVKDTLYDALWGGDVTYTPSMAIYTCRCGKISARITVQVDKIAMKKRIMIKLEGELPSDTEITYAVTPQLGENRELSRFVKRLCPENPHMLVLQNPTNVDYKGFMGVCSDLPFSLEARDDTYFLTLAPTGENPTVCFYTLFGSTLKSLEKLKALPFRENSPKGVRFTAFSKETNAFGSTLLLHNVRDSRLFARCGFYQCSGAYGFRDQLQDSAALIPYEPMRTKVQILRCCAAQFPQGDVLHWFHTVPNPKPCFKGVRTHCSDDLLWLPLTLSEYVTQTEDREILSLPVAFLQGEELQKGEKERYGAYTSCQTKASVYEHCLRAIKHSLTLGEHSLPLIKAGDWNDSFSAVGTDFKGESVWLAMFLRLVCLKFLPIAHIMNRPEDTELLQQVAKKMKWAVEKYGWNGKYFIRGYYDSGEILGDETCTACQIDLLPQAFGVFSQTGTREMQLSGLSQAYKRLFDSETLTLKLFTPPFTKADKRAGYVNDYPPGCRENGGQYTHAAVWYALALHRAGLTKEAKTLCELLCPGSTLHTQGSTLSRYETEPYAMTGDICTQGRFKGKGVWSIYTGSGSWYLRLLTELSEAPLRK